MYAIGLPSLGRVSMAITAKGSQFEGLPRAPPDPIFGVVECFKADTHTKKLNLGLGAYRTEELRPYVLNVVKKAAPEGSFILLHGCAHNPTGTDPTPEQWEMIADVVQEKNHIPLFDVAYQGFASGNLDEDASSVRMFAARGIEFLVAQSYSKNLGLYAERIGALNVVCSSPDATERVKGQLKRLAVSMYAFPPVHGARIVANVVGNSDLYTEWKEELKMMAGRIKRVRKRLYDSLTAKDNSGKDWSFILNQIGMFSYTGLNNVQNENITKKWHVHVAKGGRISLAGLSSEKCEYLADAIIDTYYNNYHTVWILHQTRTREIQDLGGLTCKLVG